LWQSPQSFLIDTQNYPGALRVGLKRVAKSEHPAAYASAGLSHDTKFDLSKVLELPYNDDY
jgi:hypothetical protein